MSIPIIEITPVVNPINFPISFIMIFFVFDSVIKFIKNICALSKVKATFMH
jgi:hypothetical protein